MKKSKRDKKVLVKKVTTPTNIYTTKVKVKVAQLYWTLCNPMDYAVAAVHGVSKSWTQLND